MNVESRESRVEARRVGRSCRFAGGAAARPTGLRLHAHRVAGGHCHPRHHGGLTVRCSKIRQVGRHLGASRQLLDGPARAGNCHQPAHTVYMVFVPTNFWVVGGASIPNLVERPDSGATNRRHQFVRQAIDRLHLCQFAFGGDQPGRAGALSRPVADAAGWHVRCLSKVLHHQPLWITPSFSQAVSHFHINYTTNIPFPTATNAAPSPVSLPFIAFNYLGQLTADGRRWPARTNTSRLRRAA